MTEYILVPRPGGYYARDLKWHPTIAADLDLLLSADVQALFVAYGLDSLSLRADVLIERIDVPLEAAG